MYAIFSRIGSFQTLDRNLLRFSTILDRRKKRIRFSRFSLLSVFAPSRLPYSLVELKSDLEKFDKSVSRAPNWHHNRK